MNKFCLIHEKITVIGPRSKIDSLMIYLKNAVPSVYVIKSSPHFPFWDSITDLFLIVCGEQPEEVIRKICSKLESGSVYRGWIDFSQDFYPIYHAQ